MIFVSTSLRARSFAASGLLCLLTLSSAAMQGQQETHGRKYQPPPATSHIVVTVQKSFNGAAMENAAVIFHATKDGKDTGNMEVKTNPDGQATMDFIEAGSHVTVQVIATGFSTYAEEFDVTTADKLLLVKLKRPRAQVSIYQDNDGKAATVQPGIQEHVPEPVQTAPPVPTQKNPPSPDAGPGSGPQPAPPPQ